MPKRPRQSKQGNRGGSPSPPVGLQHSPNSNINELNDISHDKSGSATSPKGKASSNKVNRRSNFSSNVWDYFTIKESNGVKRTICNLCDQSYNRDGSTGNLHVHLRKKHGDEIDAAFGAKSKKIRQSTLEPQLTLQKMDDLRKVYLIEHNDISHDVDAVGVINSSTSLGKSGSATSNPMKSDGTASFNPVNRCSNLSSIVWDYFTIKESNGVKRTYCNLCGQSYNRDGSTGNLRVHLSKKHGDEIEAAFGAKMYLVEHNDISIEVDAVDVINSTPSLAKSASVTSTPLRSEGTASFSPVNRSKNFSSNVWDFFTIKESNGVKRTFCSLCSQSYNRDGSTGNLRVHLRKKHGIEIDSIFGPKSKKMRQSSLDPPLPKKDHLVTYTQAGASEAVLRFVIENNHAFTVVEEPSFISLCHILRPDFKVPSSSAVKNWIMARYFNAKEEIAGILSIRLGGRPSATTELWTAPNNVAMMALTVSWITEGFEMKQVILGFREFSGEYSGQNISSAFLEICKEYEIEENVHCITTDVSANSTFIDELEKVSTFEKDNWIRCVTHVINLAVQSAATVLDNSLIKLRNLIKVMRSSPLQLEAFLQTHLDSGLDITEQINSLLALVPKLDEATHWNSVLKVVKRALNLKKGLSKLTDDRTSEDLNRWAIKDDEWKQLEDISQFLEDFSEAKTLIEGFKYPTLPCVIPIYNMLLEKSEAWSKDCNKSLLTREAAKFALDKLSMYYDKTAPINIVAIVMDPRLKMHYFKRNGWQEGREKTVSGKCENWIETRVKPAIKNTWNCYKDIHLAPTGLNTSLAQKSNLLQSIYGQQKSYGVDQLDAYLAEEPEPMGKDIFDYWKSKAEKWPQLTMMARDVLAVMATSAPSERSLSSGRDLIGLNRCSSLSTIMQACICLRSWIRCGLVNMSDATIPELTEYNKNEDADKEC